MTICAENNTSARSGQIDITANEFWYLERQRRGLCAFNARNFTSDLAREAGEAMAMAADQDSGLDDWLQIYPGDVQNQVKAGMVRAPANDDTPPEPVQRRMRTWDDFLDAQFNQRVWIVDGLVLDEGLTILGGKKRVGKSLFCLQLIEAVAAGKPVLDNRATKQCKVLHYLLEDGERRLSTRLKLQSVPRGLPVVVVTDQLLLDSTGIATLHQAIDDEKPGLVVIDTLAAAKTGKTDENSAGAMADIMNALRRLAQDKKIGILVVHHFGKHTAGDPGEDLRGSSATPSAAELVIGIYKDTAKDRYTLKNDSKDSEDIELRMVRDPLTLRWHVVGDERELARKETEAKISKFLAGVGKPVTCFAIAQEVGMTEQALRNHLDQMMRAGQLVQSTGTGRGNQPASVWSLCQRPYQHK